MARIVPAPRRAVRPIVREPYRGPVAADATFNLGDCVIGFDTAAASRAANLPGASTVPVGTTFEARIDVAGNTVNLTPAGADQINGVAAPVDLAAASLVALRVTCNGTNGWRTVASA